MLELLVALVLIGIVVASTLYAARSGAGTTGSKHSRLLGHEYGQHESAWLDSTPAVIGTEQASQLARVPAPAEGIALFRPRH
jgi:hypothetical protein